MRAPGGVPTAHVDTYVRDLLPPQELWPVFDYSAPHLNQFPDRLNGARLLDQAIAAGVGAKPIFHMDEATWTYDDLKDKVERIARVLVDDFGLVPGNPVLLRAPNSPMAAACWLAVLKAGGICVATMSLLRARELAFIMGKARVRFALCEVGLAEEMELARSDAPSLQRVGYFTMLGDASDARADLDRPAAAALPLTTTVDTAADDVALVTFTSGTTGNPKGAAHFHRDIYAIGECWPQVYTLQPDEIVVGSPSFAFTYGIAAFLIYPIRYKCISVLVPKPTPETILAAIQRWRCTSLYAVPTMFQSMLPKLGDYDVSSLRKASSAGENLRMKLWEEWLAQTGIRIVNGLGASELLSHFVCESEAVERPGSMGRAAPGYTVVCLDDEGNPLPPGNRGRLASRGPTGCRYIGDEERQQKQVQGGWNLSGDVVEQDKDGWFWYIDRADDMIISSGYNISAQEVERTVLEHPDVVECAVVGVPDDERGNLVRACVVLSPRAPRSEAMAKAIQDFVKARISPYKYPREVLFLDELPKTATGKLQRFRLRTLQAEGVIAYV